MSPVKLHCCTSRARSGIPHRTCHPWTPAAERVRARRLDGWLLVDPIGGGRP
jgi:hypothetical protein